MKKEINQNAGHDVYIRKSVYLKEAIWESSPMDLPSQTGKLMKNYQQKEVKEERDTWLRAESVSNYMATDLVTFRLDTPIMEVINTLLLHGITGAPVLNDVGDVVGLIDDKDCLRVLIDSAYYNQPVSNNTVQHYMSNVMRTITEDADLIDVANIFLTTPFKRLIVLDENGKLTGQVSRRDILRATQKLPGSTWHPS